MTVNIQALINYLESVSKEDLKKAETIEEIEKFKIDKSKLTFDQVIFYDQPFLVDAFGGDLSLVYLKKKTYTLENGRKVKFLFDKKLIEDTQKQYGDILNGYYVIPQNFLMEN